MSPKAINKRIIKKNLLCAPISDIDRIIQILKKNKSKIFDELNERSNDVELYFYIKKTFESNKQIDDNNEFKNKYRKFYVMNSAGLSQEHFNKYFELLNRREHNLKIILKALHKIKTLKNQNTFQFSFATKLLHTVNNKLPIYDKQVRKSVGLKTPYNYNSNLNAEEKIQCLQDYYEKLKSLYRRLLNDHELKSLIKECRKKFKWERDQISDVKIIDYMLWANSYVI